MTVTADSVLAWMIERQTERTRTRRAAGAANADAPVVFFAAEVGRALANDPDVGRSQLLALAGSGDVVREKRGRTVQYRLALKHRTGGAP